MPDNLQRNLDKAAEILRREHPVVMVALLLDRIDELKGQMICADVIAKQAQKIDAARQRLKQRVRELEFELEELDSLAENRGW